MSGSTKAVFLSYASQDADAARRIAEALRASGLDVWFDENELRGGDQWDAKIRRQIRECSLFMPVISAQTQERREGYFRREWKLAVERMGDMADGIAFLVPVVIDDTREADALVPEDFKRVQWTRLAGALPTPAFVELVRRLLATPQATAGRGLPTPPRTSIQDPSRERARTTAESGDPALQGQDSRAGGSGLPGWAWGLAAGIVVLGVALGAFALRPKASKPPGVEGPASSVGRSSAPAQPPAEDKPAPAADKSIAVLPFANMSDDKDNAFFTDGVHEDILTNLAVIRDLKVVSRTTVMRYRDSNKSVREIGQELGVAYVLEGSVRRAGNKVRVTGQLIKTRTDEHVWAKSYDRDLTDIFAIQAALAQEIAGALEAAISPQAQKQIARRPTDNPAAYDLFLRGRDTRNRAPTASRDALNQAEQLFQGAVDIDANFAAAWGELAVVHALKVFWEHDASPARLARAEAAAANARRLAPDAPDVIRLLGTYAYYAYRDYDRATAAYQRIIELQPNDATGYASLALILRRQGRWAEALGMHRRAVELDPANVSYLRNQLSSFGYVRRVADARAAQERLLVLLPGDRREQFLAASGEASDTGDLARLRSFVASLSAEERESSLGRFARRILALAEDDYADFRTINDATPVFPEFEPTFISRHATAAMHLKHGQPELARATAQLLLRECEDYLAPQASNIRARLGLSSALALLGRTDEAIAQLDRVEQLLPLARDAVDASITPLYRAHALALAGRKEEAVGQLRQLLSRPGSYTPANVRTDPLLRHLLGGFPPFEDLLADPKNNAPLF